MYSHHTHFTLNSGTTHAMWYMLCAEKSGWDRFYQSVAMDEQLLCDYQYIDD